MPLPVTPLPSSAAAPELDAAGRVSCPHCAVAYRPSLTRAACPVCRTPAPGALATRRRSVGDDDRLLLIVAFATLANIIVLGVLALAVLS